MALTFGQLMARLIERNRAPLEDPAILAEWGVSLADGEQVGEFSLVELDGRPGYLVLTGERFVFAALSGGTEERPLADLAGTELARKCLRVRWAGNVEQTISGVRRGDLARVAAALSHA